MRDDATGACPARTGARSGSLIAREENSDDSSDTAFGLPYRLTRAEPGLADLDPRVRLLSLDYGKTLGRRRVTPAGRPRRLATLRSAKAAAPGRLLRVHDLPADRLLDAELLDAGVDLIGTERPTETARFLAAPAAP